MDSNLLLAASQGAWPDTFDLVILAIVLALIVGVPVLGYCIMVLDYRAYLQSFKRALVLLGTRSRELPDWALKDNPPCLQALGLRAPCTEQEVLAAYRQRVKLVHPDHGGTQREFAKLQQHFEHAMQLAAAASSVH